MQYQMSPEDGSMRANFDIKLNVNGIEIERVNETKFLGVNMDYKLCWKPQMEYTKCKLCKSVAVLYKVRDLLKKKCLHIFYSLLVLPYMAYSAEVWHNAYKTNLKE